MSLITEIAKQQAARFKIQKYILTEILIPRRAFELSERIDLGVSNIALIHDIVISANDFIAGGIITGDFPWLVLSSMDQEFSIRDWQILQVVSNGIQSIHQYRQEIISIHRSFIVPKLALAASNTLNSAYAIATVINNLDFAEDTGRIPS